MTKYWWANQSDNFDRVQDTLWTSFFNSGGARRPGSAALEATSPGDVVFHCDKQLVRAVSRIITKPTVVQRPPAYQKRQSGAANDEGWLVLVETVISDLAINRTKDLASIELGGAGPLNTFGGLKRGVYLSEILAESARELLSLAGFTSAALPEITLDEYEEPFFGSALTATDQLVLAKRRVEQQYLRAALLEGSDHRCAMCHREVPENLLVAGHIKPRRACTEVERKNSPAIAMLICLLGCDSLYEKGLIAVDSNGYIVRSSRTVVPDVDQILNELVGNTCSRHDDTTAPFFRWHFDNTFEG